VNRLLVTGALLALAIMAGTAISLGADPTASPSAVPVEVLASGDLRSEGQGPGLVGNPLLILVAVIALGLATAAVTVILVRLTQRDPS
jgi:hypothetical protein